MVVVVDTNVVVSATFWPTSEGRRCFYLLAKRRFQLAVTVAILEEYREAVERFGKEQFPDKNPGPFLDWLDYRATVHDPTLLGKQRSKDADDDVFLACALTCGAHIIVSNDQHLRRLGKPFGVEIVTPRQFLARFK